MMTPAKCHPERKLVARGMCESCYRKFMRGNRPLVESAIPIDPLAAARDSRAAATSDSRDRHALKSALSRLEELEGQVENLTSRFSNPLPPMNPVILSSGSRQACAVALLSDVHAGSTVKLSSSTFGNRYNPEICRYRLGRFFAGVEWFVRSYRDGSLSYAWHIEDLVLAIMGDVIDGQLHDDQKESSESAIRTISWVEPVLIAGVRRLNELGLHVRLVCSYGNHGRDTIKPRRETGADHSYEWGMYHRLGSELAGLGVETLADPTPHQYLEVYGHKLHFTHGDEVRYQGGVGGITIPVNKRVAMWDRVHRSDLHHLGHFHQQCDHHPWFANGSVVGYNAYAMSIGAAPEPPQQTFYLLDAKRGKTAVSPIWVSDAEGERDL